MATKVLITETEQIFSEARPVIMERRKSPLLHGAMSMDDLRSMTDGDERVERLIIHFEGAINNII